MANYTCVAENLAGKRISEPAQLKVIGKKALCWKSLRVLAELRTENEYFENFKLFYASTLCFA